MKSRALKEKAQSGDATQESKMPLHVICTHKPQFRTKLVSAFLKRVKACGRIMGAQQEQGINGIEKSDIFRDTVAEKDAEKETGLLTECASVLKYAGEAPSFRRRIRP